MAQLRCSAIVWLLITFALSSQLADIVCAAPTVWSGPTITFTKTGFDTAEPTDPANQDRMTDNVWLTRSSTEGMFNIAPGKETHYIRFTSPADTEWATDVMVSNVGKTIAATNGPQLSFTTWAAAYGGPSIALGGNITTHNAVVHLISDDIYLDLKFIDSFTSGGDFTYQRSTPVPEPAAAMLLVSGLLLLARRLPRAAV